MSGLLQRGVSVLKSRRKEWSFCAVLLIFAVICCATNVISGDDVVNYFFYIKDSPYNTPLSSISGRYLSVALGYPLIYSSVLRPLVYIPAVYALVRLMDGCAQTERRRVGISWLSLCLICLMRPMMFSQIFMWLGSFTQYVTSMVLLLLYLRFCLREFAGKPVRSPLAVPLFAAVGLAASLLAEHMTIYACVLALFVVGYSAIAKTQKLRLYQIAFAVGSLAGALVMFLNQNYQAVVNETDEITFRFIEFTPIDILTQIYLQVVGPFSLKNLPLNALLAGAALLLYIRTDRSKWRPDLARFAKAALAVVIAYPLYYTVNVLGLRLLPLDGAMRVYALETAFAFLHAISLMFLGSMLMEKKSAFRFALFICSAAMCAAPFAMANPATDRCFFATYCFWSMAAMELAGQLADKLSTDAREVGRKVAVLVCAVPVLYVSYINLNNLLVFKENVRYIKEQLAGHPRSLSVIDEQYPDYTSAASFNTIIDFFPEREEHAHYELYMECLCELFVLDRDALNGIEVVVHTSIYDHLL